MLSVYGTAFLSHRHLRPTKPVSPASPCTQLTTSETLESSLPLYLSSYSLAQQILPVHLKVLKSLYLICVSLVEGVEDAVVDSPTFIHFTSSFIAVIWLRS